MNAKLLQDVSEMPPLRLTVVGDGNVGKTCILVTYKTNEFPEKHVPTVFDNHSCHIEVDGKEYALVLYDTAGQEEYDRIRPLGYGGTSCFIICYSVDSRTSYNNISYKWFPEIRNYCPLVPIILVATKVDLRIEGAEKFVTEAEGRKLKAKIKASAFVESSARLRQGLNEIIVEAVRAATYKKSKCPCCTLL